MSYAQQKGGWVQMEARQGREHARGRERPATSAGLTGLTCKINRVVLVWGVLTKET